MMCTLTIPCFTSQLLSLISLAVFFVATVILYKRPFYLLGILPLLLISLEVYARAGGGSSGSCKSWLCVVLMPLAILYSAYVSYKINKKNRQAKEALEMMSRREQQWSEDRLIQMANQMFRDLQTAWSNQDLETMKIYLHPTLYKDWEMQINSQKSRRERNVMEGVSIENSRIVSVKNYLDNERDEFTVCFDARAKDKTLIDNQVVRTEKNDNFREFWTFEIERDRWTLKEVTQANGWRRFVYAPIIDELNRGRVPGFYRRH